MSTHQIEVYRPRAISNEGVWDIEPLRFKVYGLLADGQTLTQDMISRAWQFVQSDVLDRISTMGDSNNLGFIIIHPGDLGVSVSVHWWVQGSVLCQHIQRQLYDAQAPMNAATRPVIGCVWELAIITAEQECWRKTMMTEAPDEEAYLALRTPEPCSRIRTDA